MKRWRRLFFEPLEDRRLLTAQIGGADSPCDDPTTATYAASEAALLPAFNLTTTASTAPVSIVGWTGQSDEVQISTAESRPLINLDDFQSDARFAGIDGSGFATVIIDTGIDLNHPFFGPDVNGNGIADRIVFQYDFTGGDDPDASDGNGHGSNVASIVASQDAAYPGVAPGTDIIVLKVLNDSGSGSFADTEQALQWVVANAAAYNIASVNMSLGDSGNYSSSLNLYGLGDELAALAAQNVIVVSAAGNNFYSAGTQGVSYPAADPNSLAVGAVWDGNNGGPWNWASGAIDYTTGTDRIASFSQRSTSMLDIFAPGAMINGANQSGGVVAYAGTSQAAPHIAGIATLAQQLAADALGRRLSVAEFAGLLVSTGASIFDGDDENDNVTNTNQTYRRVDMLALGEEILAMGGPSPEIRGSVWNDLDGDGAWDQPAEPGLPGWTVYLDLNQNGQFDIGSNGQINEIESNNSIATAQNVDNPAWSLSSNPDISQSTTLPHVSIAGTGNGTFDYYSFSVSQPNSLAIFDTDYTNFDIELFLYNTAGTLLASNDDAGSDPGSTGTLDSFISYVFGSAGQYVIGVGRYNSTGSAGGITGAAPLTGNAYTLHISIAKHPADEPFEVTAGDGSYSFVNLAPGNYTAAEVVQAGWTQTYPSPSAAAVVLGAGQVVSGVNFGNQSATGLVGDLDDDGDVDAADIDALWAKVRAISEDSGNDDDEDFDGSGLVNQDDVDFMLANLIPGGPYQYGDANLDGGVGGLDYTAWRNRAGTGWAHGDFDGDGGVGGLDYTLWRTRPTEYPGEVGPHSGGAESGATGFAGVLMLTGSAIGQSDATQSVAAALAKPVAHSTQAPVGRRAPPQSIERAVDEALASSTMYRSRHLARGHALAALSDGIPLRLRG